MENDGEYDSLFHIAHMFASERVAIWEYKHGPLSLESRDCIVAIIYGALVSSKEDLVKVLDPHAPLQDDLRRPPACFCDFKLDGETSS